MVRITFPNPLGPPISVDTSRFADLPAFPRPTFTRRPIFRLLILPLLVLVILYQLHPSPPFPPSYAVQWKSERNLPWLYGGTKFPEGRSGRYIKFDVPQGTGFNHQLQRVLLQHHLAILGNRSLAFEPYIEEVSRLPFFLRPFPWRSSKIPLSAFVATPISGFEQFYNTPRPCPASHFTSVCPPYKQRIYRVRSSQYPDGDLSFHGANGLERLHQLQVLLAGSEEGCIRIEGEVFDDSFFDSSGPLEIFESVIKSPVMKHFSFSPLILSVLNRVMPRLAPGARLYDLEAVSHTTSANVPQVNMLRHVLALHLRLGDGWEEVCGEKGLRGAPFVGFNKLPNLPGNENVPPPEDMVEATRMGMYRAKCLPTTLDIIARARRMKRNHPMLRMVYMLTDADDEWCEEMRKWLISEGWEEVFVGRKDIYDNWTENEVGVGVDMEVARRAGVFVGNGFSTTTSNIVLLRTRDGIHPDLTQFW